MSQRQKGSYGASAKDKLFNPTIDIEQVVLDWIHTIGNSATLVATVGDATQANTVFTMGVLNLDSFVSAILTSDEDRDWSEYLDARQKIIKDWPRDMMEAASRARKLYELTVKTWARQRLFKVRRYTYFVEGWKRSQKMEPLISTMQAEEQKEGLEQDEG